MAIDGRVIQVELTSVKEMIRLLSSASNSLNQIAKRVNVTGSLYQNDLAAIHSHYEELWEQMRMVLRKLSEI
jgi:5-methylcytosine-specific restriction endonuclease McrBC regulatory subunit McrC